MKKLKLLFFVAVLTVLVPVASSALLGDVVCGLLGCPENPPPVPEPSGALIMGAALLTLAVVRKARK
jgi:hypothetical protein